MAARKKAAKKRAAGRKAASKRELIARAQQALRPARTPRAGSRKASMSGGCCLGRPAGGGNPVPSPSPAKAIEATAASKRDEISADGER